MDVISGLVHGFGVALTPMNLAMCLVGCFLGTIVGVLPPGANALAGLHAEIWPVLHFEPPTRRGPFGLLVVGRLADGASLTSVRRELDAISVALFDAWPSFQDRVARLTPVPLREAILGNAGHTLGMLAAAVALVLLISVANVASLMLVRATGRWREVSRTRIGCRSTCSSSAVRSVSRSSSSTRSTRSSRSGGCISRA